MTTPTKGRATPPAGGKPELWRECPWCHFSFLAKRRDAVYDRPACKKAAWEERQRLAAAAAAAAPPPEPPAASHLVVLDLPQDAFSGYEQPTAGAAAVPAAGGSLEAATREELRKHSAENSALGILAAGVLASELDRPFRHSGSAIATLSKEFRATLAAAVGTGGDDEDDVFAELTRDWAATLGSSGVADAPGPGVDLDDDEDDDL